MQNAAVALACVLAACGSHADPAPAPAPAPAVISDAANAKSGDPAKAVVAAKPLAPPTIRLPDDAEPLSYDLRLELDADKPSFTGSIDIHAHLTRPVDHIWINADGLAFTSAKWDGGEVTLETFPGLVAVKFATVIQPRDLTISLAYSGTMVHDEEGLFRQKLDGRWYLFSQGESEFTRRYAPCFDEPRWKTPWRVTVTAPKSQVVASNMPVAHEAVVDGTRESQFVETPPIPSYLVAVTAGPFVVVNQGTVGKQKVPLRTLTFPKRTDAAAPVARQTGKLVELLEEYTQIPLPFPKLDIVTVPHFFGAMENPGLITFDSDVVFDGDRRYAVIAAHELAHQWFGNLVTPAWWDDLWLSEAFASWAGEKIAAKNEGHPPSELHVAYTREAALFADADANPQALHRKVTFDPDNAFDSIAYDKGEAVLAMFEAWIGEDPFRTALRAYLHDHAGGSVVTGDLVKAVAAVSSPTVGAALRAYVDHAGPPVVELALTCEGAPHLVGRARDGLAIPVCVRADDRRACALVKDATPIPLEGTTCPKIVASGGGYYNVVWTTNAPRGPLPAKLRVGDKIALGVDLSSATARGDIDPVTALAQIAELANSADIYERSSALAIAQALDPWVTDRAPWEAWLAKRFASSFKPGRADARIRAGLLQMIAAEHLPRAYRDKAKAAVAASLAKNQAPWDELVLAAGPDHAAFEALVKIAHAKVDDDQREAALSALSAFGPAEIPDAVAEFLSGVPATVVKPMWMAVGPYFERGATRLAVWHALAPHVPELAAKLTNVQLGEVIDATAELCDARDEVKAAFDPIEAKILDGRARIDHAIAAIDRCIARRKKAGDFTSALAQ